VRRQPPAPKRYTRPKPKPAAAKVPAGLSPAVRRTIVAGVKAGVPWTVVASRAGVSSHLIKRWRARGQELATHFAEHGSLPKDVTPDDMDCMRFFDELEVALSTATETFVKTIGKAGKKNWVAAAWWLERMAPQFFRLKKPDEPEKKKATSLNDAPRVVVHLPDNGRLHVKIS